MIFIKRDEFYSEVVDGHLPIKDIFSGLSESLSPNDFDELFDEFSIQLDENFDSYEKGEIIDSRIGRYKMPSRLFKRVQLTILILSRCALGATFNDSIFYSSMDFILKKELCSTPIILN